MKFEGYARARRAKTRGYAFLIALALAALPLAAQRSHGAQQTRGALRIGILPDADSLPLLVARSEGLFAAEGVEVELLPFKAAVERDAALQSGSIDGAVSDLLSAALFAQAGFDVRVASLTDGRYGIVAAPGSGIRSVRELAGVPIGVSMNSIIQYATESLLAAAGLSPSEIALTAVPKIQLRMELLLAGRLKAACLPEPLLTVAIAKGATPLAASDEAGLRAGVLLFSGAAMRERLPAIAAFYRAYAKAAEEINADSDAYRPFLTGEAGFPEEAREAYRFVRYGTPRLPPVPDVAAALSWMRAKGLLTAFLSPASILDAGALAPAP